jgi:acyl carrier protein
MTGLTKQSVCALIATQFTRERMSDTAEKLILHAVRYFKLEEVNLSPENDIFESLGIDSVQVLELLSELEAVFDVEIPDYELREVRTFTQLAEQIDKRL